MSRLDYRVKTNGKATVHHITSLKCETDQFATKEELFKAKACLTKPKRGDLVVFDQNAGYRSDGVCIYDGENVVNLACEPDEYGTIPKQFKVLGEEKFSTDYWVVYDDKWGWHNNHVWFDYRPYLSQILENIRYDKIDGKH